MTKSRIALVFFFFALSGVTKTGNCGDFYNRDDLKVTTYEEPKKNLPVQKGAPTIGMSGAATSNDLHWAVPSGWKEKPASSMRLASFDVPNGLDGSIVELAGDGGGLLANLNRWRGQIGLSSFTQSEAERQARQESGEAGKFFWYQMENPKGDAMMAAVIPFESKTVFVKLTGTKAALVSQKAAFLSLSKSLSTKAK